MMRQYELVERVQQYNPITNEDLLNKAYVYAMRKHGEQKRASGDPYFSHPLEVAAILTSLKLDDSTIVLGLLHDVIEDTDATKAEISELFGYDIANLVEGLTKTKNLPFVSREQIQAENLRKFLLAVAKDLRVLLVKLADRLHNMRTLSVMPQDKRIRIAQETMDIYAPLAARIGLQDICEELEDLAFLQLHPEHYQTLYDRLAEISQKNTGLIEEVKSELLERCKRDGINAYINGRQKRAYSIFCKMQRDSVSLEQLSDIYGFRIIVEDTETCYNILGIIHTTWSMVPGKFKDYISLPKSNGYRSIHTIVIGPRHQRVELQIRSRDMHEQAERGIATHALYKQGIGDSSSGFHYEKLEKFAAEASAYDWLRDTIANLADNSNPEEFLEHTKLELFQDQIFCFTPKGHLIKLPHGATPIDFAYYIHTDVGNRCVGCKINGTLAPLITKLKNGDEIYIICAEDSNPPAIWENIAVTGRARAAVRRATKTITKKKFADIGQQIVERAFEREKLSYSDKDIMSCLGKLGYSTRDDLFAAIGSGQIASNEIIKAVFSDFTPATHNLPKAKGDGWLNLRRMKFLKFRKPGQSSADISKISSDDSDDDYTSADALPVKNMGEASSVTFASPGGPVPGDRIVGIITPGKGVVVYPIDHPRLQKFYDEPSRWLDVRWDIEADNSFRCATNILVVMVNEPGSLAEVTRIISDYDGNVDFINMIRKLPEFHEAHIKLEVWNRAHLYKILSEIKLRKVVHEAYRVFS